jgi:hypothetical protein
MRDDPMINFIGLLIVLVLSSQEVRGGVYIDYPNGTVEYHRPSGQIVYGTTLRLDDPILGTHRGVTQASISRGEAAAQGEDDVVSNYWTAHHLCEVYPVSRYHDVGEDVLLEGNFVCYARYSHPESACTLDEPPWSGYLFRVGFEYWWVVPVTDGGDVVTIATPNSEGTQFTADLVVSPASYLGLTEQGVYYKIHGLNPSDAEEGMRLATIAGHNGLLCE